MTVRNVLLTGATGVVGSAVLPRLQSHRVVSMAHRARCSGPSVRGDVSLPHLGLDPVTYRRMTELADTVVHCAAVTDFTTTAERADDATVRGTRHILDFARDAGARLIYLSTAFVRRSEQAARSARAAMPGMATSKAYVDSTMEAEGLVRASGLPAVIARPSIVTGDSGTGWSPRPRCLARSSTPRPTPLSRSKSRAARQANFRRDHYPRMPWPFLDAPRIRRHSRHRCARGCAAERHR